MRARGLFACTAAKPGEAVRPIRQWQTEEYFRQTAAARRRAASSQRRHGAAACDLSIRGEGIASPDPPPLSYAYDQTTAEMDIDVVHQTCTLLSAARTASRASKHAAAANTPRSASTCRQPTFFRLSSKARRGKPN